MTTRKNGTIGGFMMAMMLQTHAFIPSSITHSSRSTNIMERAAVAPSSSSSGMKLSKSNPPAGCVSVTFLESNSWLWQVAGLNLLVDPVMYPLDFGVPSLIQGKKKFIDGQAALRELAPSIDWLIISQGFDDHCQPKSMEEAARLMPDINVLAPPSAAGVLERYFPAERIFYLSPGESIDIGRKKAPQGKTAVKITATSGDTLGPPWQAPENGYVLQWNGQKYKSLYYEPHCKYDVEEFERLGLSADVVITPVVEQLIVGAYPLVSGQRKAADLAKALKAKVVVPMNNGDINLSESRLPFDIIVKKSGTIDDFKSILKEVHPSCGINEAPAGVSVAVK